MAKKSLVATIMGATTPTSKTIEKWQLQQTDLINIGGTSQSAWESSVSVTTGVSGRTFLASSFAIQQDCLVKQVKINIKLQGASGNAWAFRVFRWNGTTSLYDYIGGESFTPAAGESVHTLTLTNPISVEVGDIPSVYVPGGLNENYLYYSDQSRTMRTRYTAGNITTSNEFASTLSSEPEIQVFSTSPYIVVTGDSIAEGHNGLVDWNSVLAVDVAESATLRNIPGGEPTSEIPNLLRNIVGNGSILQYQNFGKGSQTFNWVATTGIGYCVAVKPKVILVHAGVNDVSTGREWTAVEANLDTIKAAIPAGTTLMIDEILPWTDGTDEQAVTVRTWNANLAVWCAANGATLIKCHDEMGQVRAGTGEIDDLLTAYDQDGVHLTAVGVAKLAEIWKGYL